jgi:ADP-ribose pyrophosphatase YjhB (NUDIX family)
MRPVVEDSRSSPLRVVYQAAYLAARTWWWIRRPHTTGSLVALWHGNRLLLVRTSYRRLYSLPGGGLKRGESRRAGAERELFEELRIAVPTATLRIGWYGTLRFEHRQDTLTIWEAVVDAPPPVRVDGREVVWAGWKTPDEARALPLLPHLQLYLANRR